MASLLIPAAVAVIVLIALLLLVPKHIFSDTERRKRAVLGQVSQDAMLNSLEHNPAAVSLLKDLTPGFGIFSKIPGVQSTADLLVKAGLWHKRVTYLLVSLLIFAICFMALRSFGALAIIVAGAAAFFLPRRNLKGRIAKRNAKFITLFPDAVDMIVRSVRSGHPINNALRMVADNMESPIKEEFKQVVDEIAYGQTLTVAVQRLAQRIDENDVNFFVVVLSVQQETGGSLAEVLSNLSSVIRKRRQLYLKVRSLTSEGRATSYMLGGLPVVEGLLIYTINPDYFNPIFNTTMGNILICTAIGLIFTAIMVVRAMVNIKI